MPEEMASSDVFLIVSALSTGDGSFGARVEVTDSEAGPTAPDLRTFESIRSLPVERRPSRSASTLVPGVANGTEPTASKPRPPLRRSFSVLARDGDPTVPSHYDLVDSRLRAVGDRIQVFVDDDDMAKVGDALLRSIVSTFDREIVPTMDARFGSSTDVDRDGRFTVLISSRVGQPFLGNAHVDGYFRSSDLDDVLPRPLSNRADMMYLDAGLTPGPYLETILAHEYAHAVLDSIRRDTGGRTSEESWLDEAMTHLCEDLVGRSTMNLDYRVSAFLSEPNRYRVVVDDEHRPGHFRCHGNRGASYLFLRWCVEAIEPDLILMLATGRERGIANLERATGCSFADLFQGWTVDLLRSGLGIGQASLGVDLLDAIGDWPLGGVRVVTIEPRERSRTVSLEGTSSQYLRIPSGRARGSRWVTIEADPRAQLQVSAIVASPGPARVELELSIASTDDETTTVIARVTDHSGTPIRLDRLSWEPLIPSATLPRSRQTVSSIDSDAIRSLFPDPELSPGTETTSGPLVLPTSSVRSGPLIFRLLSQTPDGSRISSWAELPPSPIRTTSSLDRPLPLDWPRGPR